jgi:hypothetical protein
MHRRHETRRHRAVPGGATKVHSRAAIGDHLWRLKPGILELRHQTLSHQVALADAHHRHARRREFFQHVEVIAHVIAMVVREKDKDRFRFLARDVAGKALLRCIFGRLLHAKSRPPGVVPDPRVRISDLLVIRRRELNHAAAKPTCHEAPAAEARAGRARARLRCGHAACAKCCRASKSKNAAQERASSFTMHLRHCVSSMELG